MSELHLTRICLDYETAFKAGLRDSYAWHQKVWQAFPNRDGASRTFLTRLDEVDNGLRLLLLSAEQPVRPEWCPEPDWETKPVPESFYHHERYRFSLVANPTRKVRSDRSGTLRKNGRRVPVTSREELLDWISRKGRSAGFSIDTRNLQTIPRARQPFVKQGKVGLHAAVEFRGTLEVSDPAAFRSAVATGIGPAKAFGFGLLCLAPCRNPVLADPLPDA